MIDMEQIQQLIEILKSTPEMALWGIGMFFVWTLLKMASVVGAITMVCKLAVNKFHDYKRKQLELEKEKLLYGSSDRIMAFFNEKKISSVTERRLIDLISSVKRSDGYGYIHDSDIDKAIKAIENEKENR